MSEFKMIFYEKEDGTMPVQDFLDSLDFKMRAKMLGTIEMLRKNGNQLREPYSKPLDNGIESDSRYKYIKGLVLLRYRKKSYLNKWIYQENSKNT